MQEKFDFDFAKILHLILIDIINFLYQSAKIMYLFLKYCCNFPQQS